MQSDSQPIDGYAEIVNEPKDTSLALSKEELSSLSKLEDTIRVGLYTFIEVGQALAEIKAQKLYRMTAPTFKEYCEILWDMSDRHANRLIESSQVVLSLQENETHGSHSLMSGTTIVNKISSERQARELARIPEQLRFEALERALKTTHGNLTADAIREAGETLKKSKEPQKPDNGGHPQTERDLQIAKIKEDLTETLLKLHSAIYPKGADKTTAADIRRCGLDSVLAYIASEYPEIGLGWQIKSKALTDAETTAQNYLQKLKN